MISEALWDRLPKTAQEKLRDQAQLLAQGFTGNIHLICTEGSVRKMTLDVEASEVVKLVQLVQEA